MSRLRPVLLLVAAASCGTTPDLDSEVQNLNRPVDLAFTCYGQLRITGDGVADPEDDLVFTPQPTRSCLLRTKAWDKQAAMAGTPQPSVPPGQEDLPNQPQLGPSMHWLGFAVQSASGTVAVIDADIPATKDSTEFRNADPRAVTVLDGDLLTPGKNALSVGSLPVAIAGDPSGCFMTTANAGSCDLSVIDVDRVYSRSTEPLVRQQSITTAGGAPLLARPAAMIADVRPQEIGVACPAEPVGLLYIAYPDCHAVAVVDAATGVVQASIRFDDTGTVSIGDGNLVCANECGEMRMPPPDGARPVTLELTEDVFSGTRRLAIGLDNRPVLTVVDLGLDYLPTATVEQYELEGDVGVIDVALTPVISMTGEGGWDENILATRAAQFLYAVATDGTVRVVDTYDRNHECDTQVDPRYLHATTTANDFSCFPTVPLGRPPRRAFARGPGIQLLGDDVPLSVVTVAAGVDKPPIPAPNRRVFDPTETIGYFAFVSSSLGITYVVNIDDDLYPDFFRPAAPLDNQVALAMPHQLRDGLLRGGDGDSAVDESLGLQCDDRGGSIEGGLPLGSPRAENRPTSFVDSSQIAQNKGFQMPYVRQTLCEGEDASRALPEPMFSQPADVRAQVFPDIRGVAFEEDWSFQWEGTLSLDTGLESVVDGPQVRTSTVRLGGGSITITDPSRPFCAAGVEKYDHVQFVGCNPAQGDSQCGIGESCFVHPDSAVAAGTCLPTDEVEVLASACRDYMVSVRRFAVQQSTSGALVLSERRRVLRTSPVNGCSSNDQCQELANYAERFTSTEHPRDDDTDPAPFQYVCAPDPTRSPGINRCQMTCDDTNACEEGTVCSGGFCLEGTIPPPACMAGLQRYTLNATEAMVVIGDRTGYLHNIVEGAGGVCEPDPTIGPLVVGRFKLNPPPCTGTGVADVTPNPCSLTVDHTELIPDYTDAMCNTGDTRGRLVTRPVQAVRFRNQAFTLNITDPTYPGDAQCRHDRLGGRVGVPAVYPGFAFAFHLVAGFTPLTSSVATVMPARLVKTPDDVVWIVDEGDVAPPPGSGANTLNITGQIIRLNPDVPNAGFPVR